MERLERFYRIDHMLNVHRSVSRDRFLEDMEVSLATFKRDIEYMKDRLGAPIVWDRELRGYRYDKGDENARFSLPGLWFNEEEAHALATMQYLITSFDQQGPIHEQLRPLMARLEAIMGQDSGEAEEIRKRVKLLSTSVRRRDLTHFPMVGSALVKRRRIEIEYDARSGNELTEREVSPLRLMHYRDNWYLGAWCHERNGLRTFSLDAISRCKMLNEACQELDDDGLEDYYSSGYGIFGGDTVHWAKLRFTPQQARWVAGEIWHADQRGTYQEDGGYLLEVPYTFTTELIMDILRHSSGVEVLEPEELRQAVMEKVEETRGVYAI